MPNPEKQTSPIFSAILTPHRSLSKNGFMLVMALFAMVSFIAGMAFVTMGAWPVMGFFGLDVALLYWAFRQNYRAADEYETVDLWPDRLEVRHHERGKKTLFQRFQPYWVNVELEEMTEFSNKLLLKSHGETLRLGIFLSPSEREGFALSLRTALARYK